MCRGPPAQSYSIKHLQVEMDVLQLAGIGLAPLMGPPQTLATGQATSYRRCPHLPLAVGNSW